MSAHVAVTGIMKQKQSPKLYYTVMAVLYVRIVFDQDKDTSSLI